VGINHGGVCALAFGISVEAADIESVKITAIVIANILFFEICIFLFSFKFTLTPFPHLVYKACPSPLSPKISKKRSFIK
jgi:hypothetical protein